MELEVMIKKSMLKKTPFVVLNGEKLCTSVVNPEVNKYGERSIKVVGIFIIYPGWVNETLVIGRAKLLNSVKKKIILIKFLKIIILIFFWKFYFSQP